MWLSNYTFQLSRNILTELLGPLGLELFQFQTWALLSARDTCILSLDVSNYVCFYFLKQRETHQHVGKTGQESHTKVSGTIELNLQEQSGGKDSKV